MFKHKKNIYMNIQGGLGYLMYKLLGLYLDLFPYDSNISVI